jgi:hypothetical protein
MAQYRLSRNTEASVVDFITTQLCTDGWSGIRVEKGFSQAYGGTIPCITVDLFDRPDRRLELGGDKLSKFVIIELRVFATSDGNRQDLKDWLLDSVISGIPYYEYIITNGIVSEKILKGRINVIEITSNRKELVNLENLSKEDKFRHLLSLRCRVATTV